MEPVKLHELAQALVSELAFTAIRSGGPGGQHVNKVSTAVELRFNVSGSLLLNETQKSTLLEKLAGKITSAGDLVITSSATRSQTKNRQAATEKFIALIVKALTQDRHRIPSKPTASSVEKRLEAKRKLSEKKSQRKPL